MEGKLEGYTRILEAKDSRRMQRWQEKEEEEKEEEKVAKVGSNDEDSHSSV